ncbi:hypothetical protein [Kitasatospora sp. NPDC101183]|uniref:hypothetical protein n=1 Tax=Kitasatospora sp. NPDC101183 TaxID=3364100 RepID=UPI0037F5B60D
MTTATAVIDIDTARPSGRAVRLVTPGEGAPEPPRPAPAAADTDRARTRPAHCRIAMHFED